MLRIKWHKFLGHRIKETEWGWGLMHSIMSALLQTRHSGSKHTGGCKKCCSTNSNGKMHKPWVLAYPYWYYGGYVSNIWDNKLSSNIKHDILWISGFLDKIELWTSHSWFRGGKRDKENNNMSVKDRKLSYPSFLSSVRCQC
jgi:hypothetical protein